jgi:hypothetical protein
VNVHNLDSRLLDRFDAVIVRILVRCPRFYGDQCFIVHRRTLPS